MNKTISKKKLLHLTKFHVRSTYYYLFIITGILLFNLLIAVLITSLDNTGESGSGSLDSVTLVHSFILGIVFFYSTFKFALLNGVSRRTYYLSSLLYLVIYSFFFTVITSITIVIAEAVTNTFTIYSLMYGYNFISMFIWLFLACLFFELLGWLISCVFYRTYKKARLIISVSLLLVIPIFVFINYLSNRAFGISVLNFISAIFGFNSAIPNPFIAMVTLLVLSLILAGSIFLLVRKAGIRE